MLKEYFYFVNKEFFPNGLSANNLKAWAMTVEKFSKQDVKVIPISLPNVTYTMSCYSVLTSCEVASNFAKYDGIRFGYHSKLDANEPYTLENVLRKNRDESLGKIVKSRIVSGNYFLLKE
jgi:aspartyl-tRNA(Asn)/glutamyl-tRNA(Gln) amidotransferase subunit A